MILDVEEDYSNIIKSFEKNVDLENSHYKFKQISEEELLRLLRDAMKFQRKIEYSLESTLKLVRNSEHVERLKTIADALLKKLSSSDQITTVSFQKYDDPAYKSYIESAEVRGIISELKASHNNLLHGNLTKSRRGCYCAYFGFKSLQPNLIEIEEELRLISALTAYPVDKKIRIKDRLLSDNFGEVAISLEEAETNVEEDHFRDCVSRCRDAVEIFISLIKEKETGEKTEKHFASDLDRIVNDEVYDDAIKRLAHGVYSFLSLKGSHKYDEKKVTVYDAETALQQTYSLLEILLKKYLDFKKEKTLK